MIKQYIAEVTKISWRLHSIDHDLIMIMWSDEYKNLTDEQRKLFMCLYNEVITCIRAVDDILKVLELQKKSTNKFA